MKMNGKELSNGSSGLIDPQFGVDLSVEEVFIRENYENPIRQEQNAVNRATPVVKPK
jgi:hypothetical protein